MALSHALVGNQEQRVQLLRVQLATSVGNPPVSLLQQSVTILQQVRGHADSGAGHASGGNGQAGANPGVRCYIIAMLCMTTGSDGQIYDRYVI